MTSTELQTLIEQRNELDAKIAQLKAEKREAAVQQARSLIADFELTADELFGKERSRGNTPKKKREAKYRCPESGKDWSGFGRRPQWAVGKNLDDLLIQE